MKYVAAAIQASKSNFGCSETYATIVWKSAALELSFPSVLLDPSRFHERQLTAIHEWTGTVSCMSLDPLIAGCLASAHLQKYLNVLNQVGIVRELQSPGDTEVGMVCELFHKLAVRSTVPSGIYENNPKQIKQTFWLK